MREFYFIVSPIKEQQEREIRVYGVEKGKRQQTNYEQTAKQLEDYRKVQKKQTTEEPKKDTIERTPHALRNPSLELEMEMMKKHQVSLEERKEQLAFRKKARESKTRQHQMAIAYGKE